MKKKYLNLSQLILPVLVLGLLMQGCKTQDKLIKDFSGNYLPDNFFFRAIGQGTDADMLRAKTKAVFYAKAEIAGNARSFCEKIILDYVDQTGNKDNIDLKNRFISVSQESVSVSMTNVIVEDVTYKKEKDNQYTCYAKVKVEKGNVLEAFVDRSKNLLSNVNSTLLKQIGDEEANQTNSKRK